MTESSRSQVAQELVGALSGLVEKPVATVKLLLVGAVPSKKNLWEPRKGGGIFLNREANAQIDGLILQARSQWHKEPVKHPGLSVTFYVPTRRSDRDNRLSCILDVLQKAGVLVNDNIASCNGRVVIEPAVISEQERTVIEVTV